MPINDSAGVGIYLIDKSQRSSVAIGFRSAGAIEADRGLCNTPTLISSEADYVRVFGTPNMERHGLAAMEAYLLSQRKVPQVLVRAKKQDLVPNSNVFGAMKFTKDGKKLVVSTDNPATAIAKPTENDTAFLYFKGEGTYCKDNVVIRISEPTTLSAYAKEGQSFRVQVFDFDGASHIDSDTDAVFAFNPDLDSVIDGETGLLKLDGYTVYSDSGSGTGTKPAIDFKVSTFVNGCASSEILDYNDVSGFGLFDIIKDVMCKAHEPSKTEEDPIIKDGWVEYNPAGPTEGSDSADVVNSIGCYVINSREGSYGRQQLNCFGLSVKVTIEVNEIPVFDGTRHVTPGFYAFSCGSVTITDKGSAYEAVWGTRYAAKYSISTSLYLKNRNDYMFMGKQNAYWASYYNAYCKETYVASLSYEDFDANNISMQLDSVMGSSSYVVPKSSDLFGEYTIDYNADDDITSELYYFGGDIVDNEISPAQKSFAYSTALQVLLADNLIRWRCLATPNLGDVMNVADYLSAIDSAHESTLGISNMGRAASTDVFGNLTGRHGNRFIADYSQYAYRTLGGRRVAVTMACLVTDLLNRNYVAGMEARPPFGYIYGQIFCLELSQEFSGEQREMLANVYKINPVIEDSGYYLWKERTSQLTNTSMSDIHSIISFIWMKFAIYDAMKAFVAEYNDQTTVNRGLKTLNQLKQTFISRNYIEEGIADASRNVLGDEVLRFDLKVRFKGVGSYVDVYITGYSQTQTLAVSLAEEA